MLLLPPPPVKLLQLRRKTRFTSTSFSGPAQTTSTTLPVKLQLRRKTRFSPAPAQKSALPVRLQLRRNAATKPDLRITTTALPVKLLFVSASPLSRNAGSNPIFDYQFVKLLLVSASPLCVRLRRLAATKTRFTTSTTSKLQLLRRRLKKRNLQQPPTLPVSFSFSGATKNAIYTKQAPLLLR